MDNLNIGIVGGGIGGLTAAIALRAHGFAVTVFEKDPHGSVDGVGITQQSNVIRAMHQLGILDAYLDAGYGYDAVEVFAPDGTMVARLPSPRLVEGRPANMGVGRPALARVLQQEARSAGAEIRLGVWPVDLADDGERVTVTLSDETTASFDLLVGADGLYSWVRGQIMPEAPSPEFAGQGVWRYNLPRDPTLDALRTYNGRIGAGLAPMTDEHMYMFVTSPEPGNPRFEQAGMAARMRERIAGAAPTVRELGEQITDDAGVVYRPLETVNITGDWYRRRVTLLGDAAHATTPHLGQGAGMAIEDSLVLADELATKASVAEALAGYTKRRQPRCSYIVESSLAICRGQLGLGPTVDQSRAAAEMIQLVSQPL
ncbi:FAD-dependent oxidoreductase [Alteraurantiacibacter buctensis]|uniref:NAD(P)-binding protein n=1 Tax=Alteraurantiacibacter buctensis TaxID=1503981 RepID=A0A844YY26_9SPHN|nr:FAD-dependent oxidoreductase [Alteraurantiacibacter buctensis]MXO71908.1 NAD(P)-binding protein [Alteraurantiacibacter buctensis]